MATPLRALLGKEESASLSALPVYIRCHPVGNDSCISYRPIFSPLHWRRGPLNMAGKFHSFSRRNLTRCDRRGRSNRVVTCWH